MNKCFCNLSQFYDLRISERLGSRQSLLPVFILVFLCLNINSLDYSANAAALEIKYFSIAVSDLDRSVHFYEDALGFQKIDATESEKDSGQHIDSKKEKYVFLQLGDEQIQLIENPIPTNYSARNKRYPKNITSTDLAFQHFAIVVSDIDAAYSQLKMFHAVAISMKPQTIPQSNIGAGGIKAFKFKDPDGHPLELIYFPIGKGRDKWHVPSDKLFLGIDHSAITVFNSKRSIQFYRDFLGFEIAGHGLNTGPTQAALDAVPHAVVAITPLRPQSESGPGLELLDYQNIHTALRIRKQHRPSDMWLTEVAIEVDNLATISHKIQVQETVNKSHIFKAVPIHDAPSGEQMILSDPDGHKLLLIQH